MDKEEALEKIAEDITNCRICKKNKIGKAVPGEGNPDAQVVFIGEAPGREEAKTGRPFVGRSGKFLRDQIKEAGLEPANVYITSPVKYLPKYVTPKKEDIAHGKTHLDKQLKVIDPDIVVLLGSVSCIGVLGKFIPVSREHGTVVKKNSKKYFISYHPAAAIRFKPIRELFVKDFQKLKKVLHER